MKLPPEFSYKMKLLLKPTEFEEFIKSYEHPRYYGLRVNTVEISVEDFLKITPFKLEPIPWTADGFYYPEGENPGRHPYYYAGLYYIQEPSAMLPGAVMAARPGEYVLDLCAAPGGKTVQMAAGMKGEGLLVANDINSDRVKALVKNIELCGIRNAVVTNETPDRLAARWPGFFDRILVDAPCSGEGMFRKDEEAARSWGSFKCDRCAGMQWDILQHVDRLLKPGGYLVYSTCTFSPEEDEQMICRFMDEFHGYEIIDIPKTGGIEDGRPEWCGGKTALTRAARLWPHKLKGEGHFVAMLRKAGTAAGAQGQAFDTAVVHGQAFAAACEAGQTATVPGTPNQISTSLAVGKLALTTSGRNQEPALAGKRSRPSKNLPVRREAEAEGFSAARMEAFNMFMEENMNVSVTGCFHVKGNNLYNLPVELPDMSSIKVAKFGWYLGEFVNGRFEPSHSMATALKREELKNVIDLKADSREAYSYLKGETLMLEGKKGLTAVCVDGYTLGWGKQTGDMLKNLYPKGWRKMG